MNDQYEERQERFMMGNSFMVKQEFCFLSFDSTIFLNIIHFHPDWHLLLQTWFDLVSILADNRNLSTDATQNKIFFQNADSLVAVIRVIKKILWWYPRFQKSLPHTESEQKFLKQKSCLKIENLKQIFLLLSGWSLCSNNF